MCRFVVNRTRPLLFLFGLALFFGNADLASAGTISAVGAGPSVYPAGMSVPSLSNGFDQIGQIANPFGFGFNIFFQNLEDPCIDEKSQLLPSVSGREARGGANGLSVELIRIAAEIALQSLDGSIPLPRNGPNPVSLGGLQGEENEPDGSSPPNSPREGGTAGSQAISPGTS